MVDLGGGSVEQGAQAAHAVVGAVERTRADQPAILGHQEEQEAVDQHQQLPIEVPLGDPHAGVGVGLDPFP